MNETMNGQPIYVSRDGSTLFIPIPRELAADVPGGCQCEYCKAHPDEQPKWDTLALAAKPRGNSDEQTWTCHLPEIREYGLAAYGQKKIKQSV